MCLTTVYPREKIIKEGVGYKAFLSVDKGLIPCFYYRYNNKAFREGKWLKERQFRVGRVCGKLIDGRYPFGFHLFKRLKDANYFKRFDSDETKIIKKVKFRKGCAIGLNNWAYRDLETIVAKEIFIPNERA